MNTPISPLSTGDHHATISELCDEVDAVLRAPGAAISSGRIDEGMALLFEALDDARTARDPGEWERFRNACRAHPLRSLLQEDPLIRRSCLRPRGYAGDAEVIDFIYRDGHGLPDDCSPLGAAVHRAAVAVEPAAAVRRRLDHIVEQLDTMADGRDDLSCLSVACGHLREAQRSVALRTNRASVTGLDQDEESLALVDRENVGRRVATMRADIRHLIAGRCVPGTYDLVWSAGLYDYLDERAAKALTRRLVDLLEPGGRLLLANFSPRCSCVGFMETFMDWTLVYRDAADMHRLVEGIDGIDARVHDDASGAIVWLDVLRG